jgi:hypothetical protein
MICLELLERARLADVAFFRDVAAVRHTARELHVLVCDGQRDAFASYQADRIDERRHHHRVQALRSLVNYEQARITHSAPDREHFLYSSPLSTEPLFTRAGTSHPPRRARRSRCRETLPRPRSL